MAWHATIAPPPNPFHQTQTTPAPVLSAIPPTRSFPDFFRSDLLCNAFAVLSVTVAAIYPITFLLHLLAGADRDCHSHCIACRTNGRNKQIDNTLFQRYVQPVVNSKVCNSVSEFDGESGLHRPSRADLFCIEFEGGPMRRRPSSTPLCFVWNLMVILEDTAHLELLQSVQCLCL